MDTLDKLTEQLLTLPYAKYTSGRREIMIRCPFCGDSARNSNSTHFYIKVDINTSEKEIPVYYCHLCNAKGIVNSDFIRRLAIIDHNLISELNVYISDSMRSPKNRRLFKTSNKRIKLINPVPSNIPQTLTKIKYLNSRLGLRLSIDDLIKLKICINLYDLIDANRIEKLSMKPKMCDILDEHYIGFISYDNEYVNCRRVSDINAKRYINYNLFGKYDNSRRFYVIPNKVDILNPEPIDIHLAEGVFDILSVFFNVHDCNMENSLYIAVGGTGYYNVIDYFIKFGFIHHNLHIYSDSEIPINFYKSIKRNLGDKIDGDIHLYYNTFKGEKDFGVPKDRIKYIKSKV